MPPGALWVMLQSILGNCLIFLQWIMGHAGELWDVIKALWEVVLQIFQA